MRRIQTEALEALDGPCTFSVAALAESEMLARALARLHCSCLSQNFDDGLLDSEQREDERASERASDLWRRNAIGRRGRRPPPR